MSADVVETFGPFLIPVVVFGLGAVGYVALLLLSRWGLFGGRDGE